VSVMKSLYNKIKNLPQKPGVYQFFQNKEKILYIGKATNLKNRIRSYFQAADRADKTLINADNLKPAKDLTPAKQRMVSQIANLEYTITDNEREALLLETNLIKKHKPPYNVILKDDKYWQYLILDYSHDWPDIYSSRRPDFKKNKIIYFGPYTSGYAVKETLRLIKKIFPVCLKLPKNKSARPSPCFNYHLGRCLGPCVGKATSEQYSKVFDDIKKFITGNQTKLTKKLKIKMATFSQTKHFEAAGRIRDQIKALQKLEHRQKVVLNNNDSIDIISLYKEADKAAINLFKVRQGKLLDKFNSLVKTKEATDEEIVESFIEQYYTATTDLPQKIFTSYKLSFNTVLNISIQQTLKGKKMQLVKLGTINAREYLLQRETFFDRSARLTASKQQALRELRDELKLPKHPHRIETYDISNIQGTLAVGSMVVFVDARAKKSEYRRFKIKLKHTPDDQAMMREVIQRRLKNKWQRPDLIVVDGGITQLNAAATEIKKAKTKIPVISLAKKEEEIYMANKKILKLSKRSLALQLLQQSRDEAHRFAIAHYRLRHKKQTLASGFDSLPGIGPKTQNLLKKKYKTLAQAKKASLKELTKLIGQQKAKIIKNFQ
jgi:excinuclease ABC subunit C